MIYYMSILLVFVHSLAIGGHTSKKDEASFPVRYPVRFVGNAVGSSKSVILNPSDLGVKGPWVDVREFGAKGDTETDDTAAIQAAIDTAFKKTPRPARVYIPVGDYKITSPIKLHNRTDITIAGDGVHATNIRVSGNFTAFDLTGTCSRITIKGMWIGSFASGHKTGYGVSVVGNSVINSDTFTIEDLMIQNLYGGIRLDRTHTVYMKNITVLKSFAISSGTAINIKRSIGILMNHIVVYSTAGLYSGNCLLIDSDCDTVMVSDSLFSHGGTNNILVQHSLGGSTTAPRLVRFTNVYSESSSEAGFHVSNARDLRMTGCHSAANAKGNGFNITGGNGVSLVNCLSYSNGNHGYHITGGTGIELIGCSAAENGTAKPGNYSGIFIASNDIRVIGSRSGDYILGSYSQAYGLYINSGVDNIVVSGNDFNKNRLGGIINNTTAVNIQIYGNVPFEDVDRFNIGNGASIKRHLSGTKIWDPKMITDRSFSYTTVTVDGAAVGDTVVVGFSVPVPAGALLFGAITDRSVVTVTLMNNTGGNLDLSSGTLRADVWKH